MKSNWPKFCRRCGKQTVHHIKVIDDKLFDEKTGEPIERVQERVAYPDHKNDYFKTDHTLVILHDITRKKL